MRCLTTLLLVTAVLTPLKADDTSWFESKIRPVLIEQCYSCHATTAKKVRGDLLLDSKFGLFRGGSTGPAVVAGKPEESPLIHSIRRNHADYEAMPPDAPLSDETIQDFVAWVQRGAAMPDDQVQTVEKETPAAAKQRWPFTPLRVTPTPTVQNQAWAKNDIDVYLLARIEAKSLRPAGDAAPHQILRRLRFSLTGLPPTPEEVSQFQMDYARDADGAIARVIDRLLAEPTYGERWARHWLDVVRYADTAGDNSDFPIPQMVRYRDWVIEALNRDLPYTEFVKQQLAGDLMPGGTAEEQQARTIATGYLANARRFGSRVDDYPWHLTIEDTIDNLGRAFLGLTINCARCHDHKFDPISMGDYYALYGMFASTRYPWPGIELQQHQRDLVPLASAEQVATYEAERKAKFKEIDTEVKRLEAEQKKATGEIVEMLKKQLEAKRLERDTLQKQPLPFQTAYAVSEGAKISDAAIQIKGDPQKLGPIVRRRFLEVLGGAELPANDRTSGRLALAEWITSPQNPLFARVMVNRVWQYHFGRGLVPTVNDFGKQGQPASHPELLDYLADRFQRDGYSLKKLHKLMLTTRAFRLSATETIPGLTTADPGEALLARFRVRRLDAESIRDAMLQMSEQLDLTPGGEHPFPHSTKWNFTQHNPFRAVYDHKKRSVYLMTQRIQRHPYLAIFDGADTSAATGTRTTSTTPLQALYFLNDAFVHEQAQAIAEKICARPAPERIKYAYELLFSRPPISDEIKTAAAYLAELQQDHRTEAEAWRSLTRVLLRLNEFVYLD